MSALLIAVSVALGCGSLIAVTYMYVYAANTVAVSVASCDVCVLRCE